MKRPIFWILLFLLSGIIFGFYFSNYIVLFLIFICLLCVVIFINTRAKLTFAMPFVAILGFVLISTSISAKSSVLEKQVIDTQNNNYVVAGIIENITLSKTGNQKLILNVTNTNITDSSYKTIKFTAKNKYKIIAYLKKEEHAAIGESVLLFGDVQTLTRVRNFAGYDEFLSLRSKKIEYKMNVERIQTQGTVKSIWQIVPRIRESVSETFEKSMPQKEAQMMEAIIIGDKAGLDPDSALLFQKSGIYHILVVSGSHVTIVATAISAIFLKFLNRRVTGVIVIIFLVGYCFLTGCGVSTVRAVLTSSIVIFASLIYRRTDLLNCSALSAFILLVYEPLYIFDVGFLFSYSAVFGLIVVTPFVEIAFTKLQTKIVFLKKVSTENLVVKAFLSSFAVAISTYPVCAFYFYEISIVSIFINALILPTVFILVIAGFAIAFCGIFSISVASFISVLCVVVLNIYELICLLSVSIPFANILTGRPYLIVILMYGLLVGAFCLYMNSKTENKIKYKIGFYGASFAFLLCVCLSIYLPKDLTVTMLDVGQGDSFVVNKNGAIFIIDGGGNPRKKIGQNTGDMVLIPYLNYIRVSNIEGVFVSHIDGDHVIGIIELMNAKKVKNLYLTQNAVDSENKYYNELNERAIQNGVKIHYIAKGFELQGSKEFSIECLYPMENTTLKGNDGSMVLKLSYGEADFLFTGDLGFKGEKKLLEDYPDLKVEVLKIGHHGSKNSSSVKFLNSLSPNFALISAGANNIYSHPAPITVENIEDMKIDYVNTAVAGAVKIITDGKKIKIVQSIN